jgi:hypothetical protein
VVQRYRSQLEAKGLSPSLINVALAALRKLATETADYGLLDPAIASAVKGAAQHHHSGLQLLTPATVHYGQAAQLISKRQAVLDAAFQADPERFARRPPQHPSLPDAVSINHLTRTFCSPTSWRPS